MWDVILPRTGKDASTRRQFGASAACCTSSPPYILFGNRPVSRAKCVRGPCVPVTNPIASPQNPCSDRPSARQLSAKLESCCEGGKIVEGGCDGGGGGEEDEGKMMKRKGIQSTRGRRSRAARWKQLSLSSSPLPMRRPPPPGVAAAASGEKREDSDRENNEDGPMKDGSESRLSSVQLPVQAQAATATATAGLQQRALFSLAVQESQLEGGSEHRGGAESRSDQRTKLKAVPEFSASHALAPVCP
eukprot:CAMPEP_0196743642 /NCGR_PEP_ID=MMETSP1091-20130531/53769_1 /TAXON_ID=302021 /ORGANISM="Rhodomonas sp., Strain CCMP768" /LENGTH=245 /DNA_ID=CAMNT_0042090041 /DNA_START=193 /DNA_END=932 /DNA_ORIENTATION=-